VACTDLRIDVAEATDDHVVGRVHLDLLAGRREHEGVIGVVPGAHREVPGEVGGGLRAAVAGAVAAAAGNDALPDVRRYHPHFRYLRQVLPREAPLRAETAVVAVSHCVGARVRVAPHSCRRSHACHVRTKLKSEITFGSGGPNSQPFVQNVTIVH
jgi:hypothetical protein